MEGRLAREYFERQGTVRHMADRYLGVLGFATTAVAPHSRDHEVPDLSLTRYYDPADLVVPEIAVAINDARWGLSDHHAQPEAQGLSDWLAGMAWLTITSKLPPRPRVLVIGSRVTPLVLALAERVDQIFLTDRFASGEDLARQLSRLAASPVIEKRLRNRIVIQHMDGRSLDYPDGFFDAIVITSPFSSADTPMDIANAMFEAGRVLRADGVLSVSVECILAGPQGSKRIASGKIDLQAESTHRHLIQASGLCLTNELPVQPPSTIWRFVNSLPLFEHGSSQAHTRGVGRYDGGFVLGHVHVALAKPPEGDAQPIDNTWAKPRETIRQQSLIALRSKPRHTALKTDPPASQAAGTQPQGGPMSLNQINSARGALNRWNLIRLKGWYNKTLNQLPKSVASLARSIIRVLYLGWAQSAQFELYQGLLDEAATSRRQIEDLVQRTGNHEQLTRVAATSLSTIDDRLQRLESSWTAVTDRERTMANSLQIASDQIAGLSAAVQELKPLLPKTQGIDLALAKLEHLSTAMGQRVDQSEAYLQGLHNRQQETGDAVRLLVSRMRLVMQTQSLDASLSDAPSLNAIGIIQVIRLSEAAIPALAQANAVDVSLQPGDERAMSLCAAYFGRRLSAANNVYRAPNDAWYVFDLPGSSTDDPVFDYAVARLSIGGHLVLVSLRPNATRARAKLALISSHEIVVEDSLWHISIWKRMSDSEA
jgi:SAM-dependent methyltransferase